MACCGDASVWAKFGLICMVLAFGLQSAAFLTNCWMVHNTINGLYDIRVGLLWYSNCTPGCSTSTTPSTYQSLYFKLTRAFEGTAIGFFFIIAVIYAFYTLADRSRTRATAVVIIVLIVISELFPVAGIVLWILQISPPYFFAWSAGLSMIATGLAFFSLLCLIPDLKEYPYYSKLAVYPIDDYDEYEQLVKQFSTQKNFTKQTKKDITRKKHLKDPYTVKDSFMDDDIDRHALKMASPSKPPRYDFITKK